MSQSRTETWILLLTGDAEGNLGHAGGDDGGIVAVGGGGSCVTYTGTSGRAARWLFAYLPRDLEKTAVRLSL